MASGFVDEVTHPRARGRAAATAPPRSSAARTCRAGDRTAGTADAAARSSSSPRPCAREPGAVRPAPIAPARRPAATEVRTTGRAPTATMCAPRSRRDAGARSREPVSCWPISPCRVRVTSPRVGGRGGRGNAALKSTNDRVPNYAEHGEPGEEREIVLELHLVADVGLLGPPNAGKSTLLARDLAREPEDRRLPVHDDRAQPRRRRASDDDALRRCRPARSDRGRVGRKGPRPAVPSPRRALRGARCSSSTLRPRIPSRELDGVSEEVLSYDADLAKRARVVVGNKTDLSSDRLGRRRVVGGRARRTLRRDRRPPRERTSTTCKRVLRRRSRPLASRARRATDLRSLPSRGRGPCSRHAGGRRFPRAQRTRRASREPDADEQPASG